MENAPIAIVVPFREPDASVGQRTAQLSRFVAHFHGLFTRREARVIVVEQSDDGRRFNRGQLLNVGYALAAQGVGLDEHERRTQAPAGGSSGVGCGGGVQAGLAAVL